MTIAYLGPQASFTQIAASQIFPDMSLLPQISILDCFNAVAGGRVDLAVVSLENSIEGTVAMTLDYLYEFDHVKILAEAVMPIAHHLMVHPTNTSVEKIISHPQALAQTFHFREANFPGVAVQDFSSTSAAAKWVSENPNEPWAAVANAYASKLYGLKIIHQNIHDFEQNHTKFIVVSKDISDLNIDIQTDTFKTGLLITLPDDHAGGLHQVLSVFAWRKMNLSKIESRTLKTGLGKYFFFVNIEGKWDTILYYNALEELKSLGAKVKFLGNYTEYYFKD